MTGACVACGARGPVVADHPEGRFRGVPLFSGVVALCARCNTTRGRVDREGGVVEGAAPTPRLLVSRLGCWAGFMALSASPLLVPQHVFADRGEALQVIAAQIPADLPWRGL